MSRTNTAFFNLPGEIRNQIYRLALVQTKPIAISQEHRRAVKLNTALFRTCKAIHDEASPIFYSLNQLYCADMSEEEIALFLADIGHRNASHISHMILDFPEFDIPQRPDGTEGVSVIFFKKSAQLVASIRECVPRLTTVTLRFEEVVYVLECDPKRTMADHEETVRQVFALVDAQLRGISSLKTIIMEVEEGDEVCKHVLGAIASHGWTLLVTDFSTAGGSINLSGCDEDRWTSSDSDDSEYDFYYNGERF